MKRQMKVFALKITLENETQKNDLKGASLLKLINSIKKLPIELSSSNSRYTRSKTGNELAVIFSDELKDFSSTTDDIITGVFLKRRGNNPPLEDDGTGHLITLTLKDETHAIAEVSYFGIHIKSEILFWTYNSLVGGTNQFAKYMNDKIHHLRNEDMLDDIPEDNSPDKKLGFYYIGQPDSYKIFEQQMNAITSFEFRLAGNADFLAQAFLFEDENRDKSGIRLLREFSKNSKCGSIFIKISSEKIKRTKNKKERGVYTLNKNFIVSMYENTREYLVAKKDSKFSVKGETVDEETSILDLVHTRLMFVLTVSLGENVETHVVSCMLEMQKLISGKIGIAKENYNNEVE